MLQQKTADRCGSAPKRRFACVECNAPQALVPPRADTARETRSGSTMAKPPTLQPRRAASLGTALPESIGHLGEHQLRRQNQFCVENRLLERIGSGGMDAAPCA